MTKHNNIYLFLALACFVGIILIFILDGYVGVYDSLVMDNGQYPQTVPADQWSRQERYGGVVSMMMESSGRADFTYTIENRRFSAYTDSLDVTLWHNKVKIADLLSDEINIPSFDKREFTWAVNSSDFVPAGSAAGQGYNFIIKINRAEIERDVNVNVYVSADGIKTIPVPVPQ